MAECSPVYSLSILLSSLSGPSPFLLLGLFPFRCPPLHAESEPSTPLLLCKNVTKYCVVFTFLYLSYHKGRIGRLTNFATGWALDIMALVILEITDVTLHSLILPKISTCSHIVLFLLSVSSRRSVAQGSAKSWTPGLVIFVPAVAYHFCLALPGAFTQPGSSTFADLCATGGHSKEEEHDRLKF